MNIEELPDGIEYRLRKLNSDVLKKLGKRIKAIGELLPSDTHKLEQLRAYGADVDEITAELSRITEKNEREIYEIYEAAAATNYHAMRGFIKGTGKKYVPYAENTELKRFVRQMAKQTADAYVNMSQTSMIGLSSVDPLGNRVFKGLDKAYSEAVDAAVTAVSSGTDDYYSEIGKITRQFADSGIRTVDYKTGYSRRLDTTVRQNILWGVKTCAQGITESVGDKYGADGYEVDYHRYPRPTHAPMGGMQYAKGDGKRVDGKYYPPFSEAEELLDDYNCYHFYWPILLGISEPAYSEDELKDLKEKDEKKFTYEGKEYTGYEATQVQRKLETAIRAAKDRKTIAKASGDKVMEQQENARIRQLSRKYKTFSDAAGLPTKMQRTQAMIKAR